MDIPSSLYGRYSEVKPRMRKIVMALKRGVDWNTAVGVANMCDTDNVLGLIILNGPSPLLGGTPHFHCYLPLTMISEAISHKRLLPDIEDKIFEASLETAWGVLGLLSPANLMWVYPQERHRPLLGASLRFWDVLDAEGERYTVGLNEGKRLWSIHSNLKYVLANMGVPSHILNSPLPPQGLVSLIPFISGSDGA